MRPKKASAKSLLIGLALLAGTGAGVGTAWLALGQDVETPPPAPVILDATDLQQLVSPVALYPDPLLAEVLPACSYPDEIQQAAAFLQANPNPPEEAIDAQPFDPSVKAIVHYPSVVLMLNSQIDATGQLGLAFVNQPADVMAAVQTLRSQALASGALVSGPQQQVIQDDNGIEIYPTDDNQIYVPDYDPNALCIGTGAYFAVSFGTGYPCGTWLDYNFDWHNHWIGHGNGWNHGWQRPARGRSLPPIERWQHDPHRPLPAYRPGIRPGYDDPHAARPGGFGDYGQPADIHREDQRAQERPAPAPPRVVEPRDVPREAPHEAPAPPAREAPAPHEDFGGGDRNASAASARGNQSMGGGGGRGGGRR